MDKSRFSKWRMKCVVLTMTGLLFLDPASQALAHGGGGFAPPALNPGTSLLHKNSLGGVPVLPSGLVHGSPHSSSKTSGAVTGLTVVAPKTGTSTTELGQSGPKLNLGSDIRCRQYHSWFQFI